MAYIKAISYYLPDNVLSNEDLVREFPEWNVDKISNKVGVVSRHLSASDETAGDMAEKAARKLFAENDIDVKTIDFILLCTQSPDYFLPTTACILQDRLKIPTSAGALDYNLGCSGCVYGLAIAKGLISGGIAKNVLLLTADTYTKYLHPLDKSNRSIFGDAAAACLISTDGIAKIGEFVLGTDGGGYRQLMLETGGARNKSQRGKETLDEEGHIRREDYLYMNGSEIFNFTLNTVPPLISSVLFRNKIDQKQIDHFIFHQANKFMLDSIRKVCQLPKEKFYVNLSNTGNTVSSSILVGLHQCIVDNIITSGNNVLIAGFGVGLSWGGTVLEYV